MNETLKSLQSDYASGNYQKFIENLIANKEMFDRGNFHFNLGSAQAHLGMLGPSRYNLEMARAYNGLQSGLSNNLEFVEKQVGQNQSYNQSLFDAISITTLETNFDLIILILLIHAAIFSLLLRFKKVNSKVFGLLIAILILPIGFKYYIDHSVKLGISITKVKSFEGPSGIYKEVGEITPGYKLYLKDIHEGWAFIFSPSYLSGWIKISDIGIIEI